MGDLDPHVYAVAEEAFKRMERYKNGNVSLLVNQNSAYILSNYNR